MKKLLLERVFGLCLLLVVFTNGVWASTDVFFIMFNSHILTSINS